MTDIQEQLIRDYIQKYANKHGKTIEEAKQDAMCKLVQKYYGEDITYERNDISR